MFKNYSLRSKLTAGFIVIGFLSILLIAVSSFFYIKNTLIKDYFSFLSATSETKKQQVESYIDEIRNQIITFSDDLMTINAIAEFIQAASTINETTFPHFKRIDQELKDYYQKEYIDRLNQNVDQKKMVGQYYDSLNPRDKILQYYFTVENKYPFKEKYKLINPKMNHAYDKVHEKFHPIFDGYVKRFGYADFILVDAKTGDVVYSHFKEFDFATNLLTGPYKDVGIGQIFKEALTLPTKDATVIGKFAPYDPSYGYPIAFMASPLYNKDERIGILILQLPIEKINAIMTNDKKWTDVGLGATGETFLVDLHDNIMLSDSRSFIEKPIKYEETLAETSHNKKMIEDIKRHKTTIVWQTVNSESTKRAAKGKTGAIFDVNYLGTPVLSAFVPLEIEGLHWAVFTQMATQEVYNKVYKVLIQMMLWGLLIVIGLIIVAYFLLKYIIAPLTRLTALYKTTIDKEVIDLTKHIDITSNDEIGQSSSSFNTIIDTIHVHIATLVETGQQSTHIKTKIDTIIKSLTNIKTKINTVNEKRDESFKNIAHNNQEIPAELSSLIAVSSQVSILVDSNQELLKKMMYEKNAVYQTIQKIRDSLIKQITLTTGNHTLLDTLPQSTPSIIEEQVTIITKQLNRIDDMLHDLEHKKEPDYAQIESIILKMHEIKNKTHTIAESRQEHYDLMMHRLKKIQTISLHVQEAIQLSQSNSYALAQLQKECNEWLLPLIKQIEINTNAIDQHLQDMSHLNISNLNRNSETERLLKSVLNDIPELNAMIENQKKLLEKATLYINQLQEMQEKAHAQLQLFKV